VDKELDWASRIKPNKSVAIMLAKRVVSVLVCDAVQLEGINFTLPEIQTLLDGITVGGHKLSDQQIATNQGATWRYLFELIEKSQFAFSIDVACRLHNVAGKEEALEWGCFRSGAVTIAGSEYLPPEACELAGKFDELQVSLPSIPDIYDRAIHVFLAMARNQFFYDVNKRMGRFMMNGLLLDAGYPVINLPAKRQLEFNELMLNFYASGDEGAMNVFMRSCVDSRLEKVMASYNKHG
jgi:Fic family protein